MPPIVKQIVDKDKIYIGTASREITLTKEEILTTATAELTKNPTKPVDTKLSAIGIFKDQIVQTLGLASINHSQISGFDFAVDGSPLELTIGGIQEQIDLV